MPLQHPWNLSPAEAIALQRELAAQVERRDRLGRIQHIAGVDVGFENGGRVTRAAVAVLDTQQGRLVDAALVRQPTRFPYIPGLLSFRECPAILAALDELQQAPDLLFCDGQGLAHPRRLGVACHLGLLTGLPAIGVGKSRLCGQHDPVPEARGSWVPLHDTGGTGKKEIIGAVLRSRSGVRPLYVSIGHRISLNTAIDQVLNQCRRYRLPEPIRWADGLASRRPWVQRQLQALAGTSPDGPAGLQIVLKYAAAGAD